MNNYTVISLIFCIIMLILVIGVGVVTFFYLQKQAAEREKALIARNTYLLNLVVAKNTNELKELTGIKAGPGSVDTKKDPYEKNRDVVRQLQEQGVYMAD